jgi:FkbM family methyltransferase
MRGSLLPACRLGNTATSPGHGADPPPASGVAATHIPAGRAMKRLLAALGRARSALRRHRSRSTPAADATFTRSIYGPLLRDTPGDRTFELCLNGYDTPLVADTVRLHERPFVFLDIGANLGIFSLLAARNPHCVRALAFEPLPGIFANLQANVARNGAELVEVHCAALTSARRHHVYLRYDARHSGMAKIVPRARRGCVRARAIDGPALGRLVGEPQEPILAKIDVEGSERDVLQVLRQSGIYPAVNTMVIEISEQNLGNAERAALLAMLAEDGFVEVKRSGPQDHYDAVYRR